MSSSLKCLDLLEFLAQEPYAFSLSEIADLLSVAKSSAHRFLATLTAAGYVEQDGTMRRYQLAGKALWVGTAYLRHSIVYRCGFAALEDLVQRAATMAHLATWDNNSVLYLHSVGPPRSLNLFADTGDRRPVHATALGKVMLANRPRTDLKKIFAHGCQRFTENTITSISTMETELAKILENGYAVDREEGTRGVICVAAAIKDQRENVVAAISISGSSALITDKELLRFVRLVQEAALRVSVQLGYRPATSNLSTLLAQPRR